MKKILILVISAVMLTSCQEKKRIYIASHVSDCIGIAPQKCLLYKESQKGKWLLLYGQIDGFTYEKGYTYELDVSITKKEKPNPDGSFLQYTLLNVVSKKKDDDVNLNDLEKNSIVKNKITSIAYEASSRGSFYHVKIDSSFVATTVDRNFKTVDSMKNDQNDWQSLSMLAKDIDLENLSNLKPPSELRATDRVPHAYFTIVANNKTYATEEFDHGNPPEPLKSIITSILKIAKYKN